MKRVLLTKYINYLSETLDTTIINVIKITEPLDIGEVLEEETDEKQTKQQNVPKKMSKVKVVTQEEKDCGKYSIFDIVLPLPGHSVVYPPNMKDYYEELLKADGLDLDMKHSNK